MSVQASIESVLTAGLQPQFLEVVNESHMHSVPANSETHFKVVLVTEMFEGKRSVARHQMVYKLLADQLAGPVHALALHTYTGGEWGSREQGAPVSPDCKGGSKTD